MADNSVYIEPLPATPRPTTAQASRRSWAEAPVRVWMILTVFILVSLGLLVSQYLREGLSERRLIVSGVQAVATIMDVDGNADPRKSIITNGSASDRIVHLTYKDRTNQLIDAPPREVDTSRYDGRHPTQTMEIRYDPDQPTVWTDRIEPQPWSARMAIVWMLLPVLALALAMMLLRRRQMLGVWRNGEAAVATVVDLKQSSIAPRSRLLRFTLEEADDRRIFSTLFPNSAGAIEKGDELVVLRARKNSSRMIVAELYGSENKK